MAQTTSALGLSSAQAAARLSTAGPNVLPARKPPSFASRIAKQLTEALVLILLAAGLASIVIVGEAKEGVAILVIVVLDVLAGAWQEHRADQAVAALADLTPPQARVHRDGEVVTVPARDIVPGDVVELAAGDRVPADIRLLEAKSLAIDESMLTGESLPVEKDATATATAGTGTSTSTDAYAGTLVVRGRAVGHVFATGAQTELGSIASSLTESPPAPLQRDLRAVGHIIAVVAIALGAVLVAVAAIRSQGDDGFAEALLAGVSLAVAAIPEGLPAAVTLALAIGAQRMAGRGAIVRRLGAIEALGATTVLCIDKTGTLTEGNLHVVGVDPLPGRELALWNALLRANDAPTGGTDPVDVALLREANEQHQTVPREERVAEAPFDATTKLMATVNGTTLSVKGAPEAVLARCRPGPDTDALARHTDQAATAGQRVLVAADAADTMDLNADNLRPLGLVRLADPLRDSATAAVGACRQAGIRVVVVTGDHRDTAVAIAKQAGLVTEPAITQAELDELPPHQRQDALARAAVVARCTPAVKVELVAAHRQRRGVIAMTGDGVNDAPALRQADVGVAVSGGSGTDVARQAADIVVTNGDLGTIVAAVREGRRIYRNLLSVVSYLVAGNLSEIAVVMAGVVLIPELAVPLLPVQLLWVNLVTDGLPALALGVDKPPDDPMAHPPRRSDERLLDVPRLLRLSLRAAVIAAVVLGTGLYARRAGFAPEVQRAQLLTTLVMAHLVWAYAARADRRTFGRGWHRNRALLAAVAGSIALHAVVVIVTPFRGALDIAALPVEGWLVALAAVAASVAGFDAVGAFERYRSRDN